jgi:hypothetical protein
MVNADVLERVASLREKVATFGMSEREIDLWKFKDLGEMDKNIKNLDAWHRQLESMQLTKQIQDADPLERFKQRVKEIQELKQSGFLSDAIFGKALQQQSRDLLSGANLPGYRNQEALIRGSSAEVSAVIRSKRPEEKLADQLKEAMRVLQEQGKNQEKLQRDILDFLKENGLKVVDLP